MKKEEPKVEKKEVSFISVINIIVGVILVILFLLTIISKFFIPAGLFFILAVFIFLPQKILKFSKWLKLLIAVIGILIALAIVGYNLPSQQIQFENHNLNEEFPVLYNEMNFSMIIYNSTKEDTIIMDGKEKTTNGIFLIVYGSIKNPGDIPSGFGFQSALFDNQNKSYSVIGSDLGTGAIQPGLNRDFINIFEIPKETSGLKFIVQDETNILNSINLEI